MKAAAKRRRREEGRARGYVETPVFAGGTALPPRTVRYVEVPGNVEAINLRKRAFAAVLDDFAAAHGRRATKTERRRLARAVEAELRRRLGGAA